MQGMCDLWILKDYNLLVMLKGHGVTKSQTQLSDWTITTSNERMGFPGDSVVKNPPANAGDMHLIPGLGRCPEKGNGNPLQYCLRNLMDRRAWQLQRIAKSQTQLSNWTTTRKGYTLEKNINLQSLRSSCWGALWSQTFQNKPQILVLPILDAWPCASYLPSVYLS